MRVTFQPDATSPPPPEQGPKVTFQEAPKTNEAAFLKPSEIVTDFPDNDEGNTLVYLENTLIDRYAQYAKEKGIDFNPDNAGDRTHALEEMKKGMIHVRGKLLKKGERADSPIVLDTYEVKDDDVPDIETAAEVKARTANQSRFKRWFAQPELVYRKMDVTYFKFHMTWEMELELPDGTKETLRKSQWIKTLNPLPDSFDNPREVEYSKHKALLYIKSFRHVHKAALSPKHKHYEKVKTCVEQLRISSFILAIPEGVPGRDPASGFDMLMTGRNVLKYGEMAYQTDIGIWNGKKRIHLTLSHLDTMRKLDDTFTKWQKTSQGEEGAVPQGYKIFTQAQDMVVRDARFNRVEKIDRMSPEEMLKAIEEMGQQDPIHFNFQVFINRTKELFDRVKRNFDQFEKQLRASMIQSFSQGIIGSAYVSFNTLFGDRKFINKQLEQLAEQLRFAYAKYQNDQNRLAELKQSYQGVMNLHKEIKRLENIKNVLRLKESQLFALDKTSDVSKSLRKREKKLATFQPILDLNPLLDQVRRIIDASWLTCYH